MDVHNNEVGKIMVNSMNKEGLVIFFQKHKTSFFVVGIFLLALMFRIFLFRYRFAVGFDEPHYLQLAIAGRLNGLKEMLHPYWPPVFPLFIALFSFVISNVELAGRLVSAVLGSALIVPIFYLTKLLFDKKIAVIAMLLVALNPLLAFMNTSTLVESTFMTLAISGIVMSWKALQQRSLLYGLIAGFLWSLSYLTRPDGIGFVIIFSGFVIGKILFDKTGGQKKKLLLVWLVVMLSFVVTASPYLRYLHQQVGKWNLSLKWEVGRYDLDAFRSLSSDNQWLPVDMAWHLGNFQTIHELPDFTKQVQVNSYLALREKIKNFYKVLNQSIPKLLSSFLFVLCILGFFKVEYTPQRVWLTFYLLAVILFFWFLVVPLFFVNDRYLIPMLPLCFIWVGKGIQVFWTWLVGVSKQISFFFSDEQRARIIATASICGIVFFLSYLPELGKVLTIDQRSPELWADAIELKKAGLWLKEHTNSPPVIMSYNKAVDFYAGQYDVRKGGSFADNSFDRILKYACYRGVEYLVIDERYKEQFPLIAFLLEQDEFPKELELIYEDRGESGFLTRIFKLVQ